jgi:hypothetical protein
MFDDKWCTEARERILVLRGMYGGQFSGEPSFVASGTSCPAFRVLASERHEWRSIQLGSDICVERAIMSRD